MNQTIIDPISVTVDENDNAVVTYYGPVRKFGNVREELFNDANSISNKFGHVYVALSGGMDSQIIVRSFLDAGKDFTPFFIHAFGFNDDEYEQVMKSNKFFGIKTKIIPIDVLAKKDEWLRRQQEDKIHTLMQYNIVDGVAQLEEDFPIVMCGPDICIVGNEKYGICATHNYSKGDNTRFKYLRKNRTVIDFPYSPEAMASQYCDPILQAWLDCKEYFDNNGLVFADGDIIRPNLHYQYYVKPLLKAQYFKKDIMYFGKKSGYENYPDWIISDRIRARPPYNHDVTVPVKDAIEHLSLCDGSTRTYTGWIYPNRNP